MIQLLDNYLIKIVFRLLLFIVLILATLFVFVNGFHFDITLLLLGLFFILIMFKYLTLKRLLYIFIPLTVLSPSFNIISGFPAVRLDDIWLVIGLVVLTLCNRLKINVTFIKTPVNIMIFFIFWIFVTIVISIVKEPTNFLLSDLFEPIKFVKLLLIFIVVNSVVQPKHTLNKLIEWLLVAITLSAMFGIFQYFNWFGVNNWLSNYFIGATNIEGFYNNSRVVGTFGNPNTFAGALLIGLGLVIPRLFYDFSIKSIFYFFTMFYALILTQSRTGLLVIIILLLISAIYFFIQSKTTFKDILIKVISIISIPIVIGIFRILLPENVFRRVVGLSEVGQDVSLNTRLMVWEETLRYRTFDNLILGTGPTGGFRIVFDNEWLHILTHYGLVGLLIFVIFNLSLLSRVKSSVAYEEGRWYKVATISLLVGMSIYMVTASVYHTLQLGPLFVTAIALGLQGIKLILYKGR